MDKEEIIGRVITAQEKIFDYLERIDDRLDDVYSRFAIIENLLDVDIDVELTLREGCSGEEGSATETR